jgi:hypothetical protein
MQGIVRRVTDSLCQAYVGKSEKIPMKNLIMFRVLITGMLAAVIVYAGVLLVGGVPGKPGEWAVMIAVIAIPVLVLIQVYLRRGKKGKRL